MRSLALSKILIISQQKELTNKLNDTLIQESYLTFWRNGCDDLIEAAKEKFPDLIIIGADVLNPYQLRQVARLKNDSQYYYIPVLVIVNDSLYIDQSTILDSGVENIIYTYELDYKQVYVRNLLRLKKAINQSMQKCAYYRLFNPVAKLPNKKALYDYLRRLKYTEVSSVGMLLVSMLGPEHIFHDIEFKHTDKLIESYAYGLREVCTNEEFVAYVDTGTFAFVIKNVDKRDVINLHDRIKNIFYRSFVTENHEFHIHENSAATIYPYLSDSIDYLLNDSQVTLKNKSSFEYLQFLDEELKCQRDLKAYYSTVIENALRDGEIKLHYQPILDISTGDIVGVEALLRWSHNGRKVPPPLCISIAQEQGLMKTMHEIFLRQILQEFERVQLKVNFYISVNLSPALFFSDSFRRQVVDIDMRLNSNNAKVAVELTEVSLMVDVEEAKGAINELSEQGISTYIDDFGTGYCSFAYLQDFNAATLKIDKSFIGRVDQSSTAKAITTSIAQLSDNLGLKTIAEGIENADQAQIIQDMGCEFGQGFYYYKPMPFEQLIKWLAYQGMAAKQ